MLPDRENLSVAGLTKADRTFPGEVAIVEALTAEAVPANQASPIAVGAIALLEEVSEAAKPGNRATEVVQAVKAHPHEVAEVGVPVAAVDAPGAVGAVAEAAVVADAGN
jgi:hypothetical protein